MDQTDLKILNILQDNARITISELGRMINMTGLKRSRNGYGGWRKKE